MVEMQLIKIRGTTKGGRTTVVIAARAEPGVASVSVRFLHVWTLAAVRSATGPSVL
jgi:hypothetical protein